MLFFAFKLGCVNEDFKGCFLNGVTDFSGTPCLKEGEMAEISDLETCTVFCFFDQS